MKQSQDEEKEELPSVVDDAASVILESKRKEASVKKNAPVEEKPVSGLIISVTAFVVLFVFIAILIYLL